MKWENLREEEFEDAIKISKGVCVIPMGCYEMHGQHLPVGTDNIETQGILDRAAEIEPVCVFPGFTFGDVSGLYTWKGAVMLRVELIQELLTQLCSEIARNGFKKILILNGHGGNVAILNNFVRSTTHDKKDYVVMSRMIELINPYKMCEMLDRGEEIPELTDYDVKFLRDWVRDKKTGGHGCIMETGYMMDIRPETVRLDRADAVDGLSTHKADFLDACGLNQSTRFWGVNYPNSYCGHSPVGITKTIAAAMTRIAVENTAKMLKILKDEDQILKWNEEKNKKW